MSKDDKAKSNLRNYIPWFIFFGLVAIAGYATKYFGVGNFAIFFILLMLLYHFVLDRATQLWQERVLGQDSEMDTAQFCRYLSKVMAHYLSR